MLDDAAKWNKRASVVYAVGVWTMIGSYAYMKYTGRYDDVQETKKEEHVQEQGNLNEVVYETSRTKTTMSYKKDFVPYSTRFFNFIHSFISEPGTGDSKK